MEKKEAPKDDKLKVDVQEGAGDLPKQEEIVKGVPDQEPPTKGHTARIDQPAGEDNSGQVKV